VQQGAVRGAMKLLGSMGDAFHGGKANSYGQVTLLPEEIEDLWHTYNLIAKGDTLLATTFRKVQKESSTGSVDSQKVKMSLAISVGRVDFDPDGGSLRVSGTIASEHEGLRLGSHHTLELELHRKYTLAKAAWDSLYLERVAQATDGPVATADVAALLMQQGLANLCLVSGGMSITRARLECRAPTKGNAAVQAGATPCRPCPRPCPPLLTAPPPFF
jgi:protein pelota